MDITTSTHPLAPPTQEAFLIPRLRLIRSRKVGATTFHRLLAEHGGPEAALEALPAIARAAGITDYQTFPEDAAHAELERGRACGARPLTFGAPDYPAALMDLSDAPPVLWAMGTLSLLTRPAVALVGARNASSLGRRMAHSLASNLGKAGMVTVSGLARGIDTEVHAATIESGTIAVQAGGIDGIYPKENIDLAARIDAHGLRLSEAPMGVQPQARHFPARNRIISGLARAVIVVEAAAKSGSLITARDALDQGREVMAVPGHPFDPRAAGANLLLRDGARLIRGAQDVLETLGNPETDLLARAQITPPPSPSPPRKAATSHRPNPTSPPKSSAAPLTEAILTQLGPVAISEDQLIRDLGRSAQEVATELVLLELDGRVARHPGGMVALVV